MNTIDELYAKTTVSSSPSNIRLLTVLQPISDDEELKTRLTVGNLEETLDFVALSYVWTQGSSEDRIITCGNSTLTIGTNCHSALKQLRKRLGSYVIWVDAICINQKDDLEKGHQVSLMGMIYSKAQNVYVWLGDGDAASDRAMVFLNGRGSLDVLFEPDDSRTTLRRVLFSTKTWGGLWNLYRDRWRMFSNPYPTGAGQPMESRNAFPRVIARYFGYVPVTYEPLWYKCTTPQGTYFASAQDLSELFARPWMRRIWTYQEIIFANGPVIMCGDLDITWGKLASKVLILEFISNIARWDSRHPLAVLEPWRDIVTMRERLGITSAHLSDPNAPATELITGSVQSQLVLIYHISNIYYWIRAAGRFNLALWYMTWLGLLIMLWLCTWSPTGIQIDGPANSPCIGACELHGQTCQSLCTICHQYQELLLAFLVTTVLISLLLVSHILGYFVSFPSGQQNELDWMKRRIVDHGKIDLVSDICHRKSANSLDQAYAVHAVLEHLLDSRLSAPKYSYSQNYVYKRFMLDLIRATRSTEVLLAAAVCNLPSGPSWVADWSADFSEYWMRSSLMYQTHRDATFGSTTFSRYIANDANTLVVRGLLLCTVDGYFRLEETKETFEESEKDLHLSNLSKMRQFHDSWFPSEVRWWLTQHLHSLFRRSIPYLAEVRDFICNPGYHTTTSHSNEVNEESLAAYWKFLFYWSSRTNPSDLLHLLTESRWAKRGWYLWFMSHRISGSYRRYRRAYVGRSVKLSQVMLAHIAVCNTLARTQKMFFYTEKKIPMCTHRSHVESPRGCRGGGNIYHKAQKARDSSTRESRTWGICKSDVKVGDQIVLIAGLKTPLVLRPCGRKYRIVSPAVVVGIMQGQAWPCNMSVQDEEEQLQYFRLV